MYRLVADDEDAKFVKYGWNRSYLENDSTHKRRLRDTGALLWVIVQIN